MPACPGGLGRGKLLAVGGADWASEPQANTAHPKRMSAGAPSRPLHYPGNRPGGCVSPHDLVLDPVALEKSLNNWHCFFSMCDACKVPPIF